MAQNYFGKKIIPPKNYCASPRPEPSAWRTEKDWDQLSQFFWRLLGGEVIVVTDKKLNSMADSTVPITVVPRSVIQEPIFGKRRIMQSSFGRSCTVSANLISLAS